MLHFFAVPLYWSIGSNRFRVSAYCHDCQSLTSVICSCDLTEIFGVLMRCAAARQRFAMTTEMVPLQSAVAECPLYIAKMPVLYDPVHQAQTATCMRLDVVERH